MKDSKEINTWKEFKKWLADNNFLYNGKLLYTELKRGPMTSKGAEKKYNVKFNIEL